MEDSFHKILLDEIRDIKDKLEELRVEVNLLQKEKLIHNGHHKFFYGVVAAIGAIVTVIIPFAVVILQEIIR